ncbi:unnamed protein product [Rotaria sp. Silwood1]|nr:unnamed protein product [Rotaria sp. Silwood1]CAF0851985.1 unnamed protein product [Rotaria sp. Silwood1]CAF0962931.1 unnamed protein product [Rotaria sp. Silwood1]CAF3348394.1 unnamed protein product [Rotaria sp. Silwood1]CAF3371735.1 unnamed protein product [Rotaria sp. Silwood1]
MLLRLWQNLRLLEKTLSDHNEYRMYATVVTEGLNFATIESDSNYNSDQGILDIDKVRILPMSHEYNPSSVHAGLLIYSVDGQTDFILNDAMFRMKTGDIIIRQIHHVFSGPNEMNVYRDLIRTLFGTHRINLIGLVFTFSGDGQFTNCMRWGPMPPHTTPIHSTEQKLLEIVLVTLYMNKAWLSMPIASHVDMETLFQSGKKQYLLKLADIEQLFHKRRKQREKHHYLQFSNLLKLTHHYSSDDFRSFEWTPNRQQMFDETIQSLLNEFYNIILQTFQDEEFDSDEYVYYDNNTKRLFSNLVHQYTPLTPAQNYYWPQEQYF